MTKNKKAADKKELTPLIINDTCKVILESISDGVFTIDYNWKITSFNHAAQKITGISSKDAIGRYCWEVLHSNMCEQECTLKKTMEEGRPFINSSGYIITNEKKNCSAIGKGKMARLIL